MSESRAFDAGHVSMRSRLFDAVVASLLTALSLTLFLPVTARQDVENVAFGTLLVIVHSGCLVLRRRIPGWVMGINIGSALIYAAFGFPFQGLGVSALVALYSVAALRDRSRSLIALGASVVAMVGLLRLTLIQGDLTTVVGNAIVLTVAWFLGDSQRVRRAYVLQLEERTAELERARDELARSAVAEERLRIARELHDIIGHSLGMIAVQAGVGAHVVDERPEEAKRSLQAIEEASRSGLSQIRSLLGVLRSNEDDVDMQPAPSLDDLRTVAADIAKTGLSVDLEVAEQRPTLPSTLELAIFRVVQEALTNVVKHAHARSVTATVSFVDGQARVEIVDDGLGRDAVEGRGHGIAGMRERVLLHGGSFEAGPSVEGGFRVAATMPLEGVGP